MRSRAKTRCAAVPAAAALAACLLLPAATRAQSAAQPAIGTVAELGRALFADRNLSVNRRQSCVSCHSPELAFTDPRELGKIEGAVSLGADGHSFGDRNSPSIAYASFTPEFQIAANDEPMGGFFWDGRARTLEDQAGGPPLNPVEMGMPDKHSVVARIKENPRLADSFRSLFAAAVLDDTGQAFAALTKAIAAYERTAEFSPFDSKYDRSLRGETALTAEETLGRDLFFSRERSSCSACHLSNAGSASRAEVFTGFKYYNIGTPPNRTVRALNGSKAGFVDVGLATNPAVSGAALDGKFKVPGLRNVAITGPYTHNGIFKELRTALLFHQRLSPNGPQINPETGQPWESPETPANLATESLKTAPALNGSETGALIAFLKTLTDRRYERLLE
ncbi:MAG: cytochrome-c peroxidase [Rhodomicrobium sp.]